MSKYLLIKEEFLVGVMECFNDADVMDEFISECSEMLFAIYQAYEIAKKNPDDKVLQTDMLLKQLFVFSAFCRRNIDIVHDLVKIVDYEEVTGEEFEKRKLRNI